eukprot:6752136-Prymnesium_polylepis.1
MHSSTAACATGAHGGQPHGLHRRVTEPFCIETTPAPTPPPKPPPPPPPPKPAASPLHMWWARARAAARHQVD